MNSISPALASVSTPVKSGRGMEQNSKLDGQNDTKFQLPEKKSKGNSESVANQNDTDDSVIAKDKAPSIDETKVEDTTPSKNAESALLELINAYQPRNAEKSDASDAGEDPDVEILADEVDVIDAANEDAASIAAAALAQSTSNENLNKDTKAKEAVVTKGDVKPDEKSARLDKSQLEGAQSTGQTTSSKANDDAVRAAPLQNAMQDKDAQTNTTESIDSKKSSAVLNAEKAMSDGAKDQGSKQNDDRTSGSNISMVDKSGTKMAGVEVLEAKTFIAPTNASANANNISQAILKSPQISSAAAAQSSEPIYQTAQPKALNTLKIQLNPAELGVVTATMKLNGDNLQVQLRVENIDAYRMLSEDSSSIVKALKGQGFGIDQINVTLASSDRGSNQQGNAQNGQSFQSHTDQEQMKNQSGNDRNNGSENSKNAESMVPANELAPQETGQKDTYSGGVYL
ncbi:MAG: flagellar hook-length control protein FliK [Lentilitoribacter sp.]